MTLRERALLARLRERDETAFTEVVRDYQNRVFNLVYRMIGSREEAEDLAQEVFVTVFKSIEQFRGDSKFSTWLYRIAANHCKNRIKYLSRRHTASGGLDGVPEQNLADGGRAPLSGHVDAPDAILEGREIEKLVQQAIAALDDEHRLLVLLRDVEELSYQEIVDITGLNEGTVKSRLHRARMQIKEYIDRHTGKGKG
ncbi:MAG TPA: sigma-70 family RNA polymerase sigma factor [Polyangia bacterium]|nr:sigma-70 family RNA polymerase sigma factor [Polyangia bacterium]